MYGSASHEARQSDIYRSVKTLDQLTAQLNEDGFQISDLRLLPKRSSSLEGKCHILTVPLKLIRAQLCHACNENHVIDLANAKGLIEDQTKLADS